MVNLVGGLGCAGPVVYEGIDGAMLNLTTFQFIYMESLETKPNRKMGHATVSRF